MRGAPTVVQTLCERLRPLILHLPMGRVRVLRTLGGGQGNYLWQEHPRPLRRFFDEDLGAWVEVDLRHWEGRWHYFSGHYYDQDLPWVMRRVLREGDCFIDVGANVGFHTMRAAKLVTSTGRVVALEPAETTWRRLEAHLATNDLDWVERHKIALGDVEGESILHVDPMLSGLASLRSGMVTPDAASCFVSPLDTAVTPPAQPARALVKIDVEGFELRVILGTERWRRRKNTLFYIEITPKWIKDTGGTSEDLFALMNADGYHAYRVQRLRGRRYGKPPLFIPVDGLEMQAECLFVRAEEVTNYPWLPQQSSRTA